MALFDRDWYNFFCVISRSENYYSLINFFRRYSNPINEIYHEIVGRSSFPIRKKIKTKSGFFELNLFNNEDCSTLNGIFCREDYKVSQGSRVFIDIGANIGIASLYFLTEYPDSFVYAYEPVPENIQKINSNISESLFNSRFFLKDSAVCPEAGTFSFTVEETGKFGHIDFDNLGNITVQAESLNSIIESVLQKHQTIDCIKIDTEGLERELIKSILPEYWDKIKCIVSENTNSSDLMPKDFIRKQFYNVEHLINIKK